MASNMSELIESIQREFAGDLGDCISEYELSIIEDSIRILFIKVFGSANTVFEQLQSCIQTISQLNYLRSKISSIRYSKMIQYRPEYERMYTSLTRMGRPSKQAIDSEIFSTNQKLSQDRNILENLDNLLVYLDNQYSLLLSYQKNLETYLYKS
jgi:hypothetical protein